MKSLLRIIIFLTCFAVCIFLFVSCSKNATDETGKKLDTNTICTATKEAAENIQIFPSDNPWNLDISAAPVDPYSTQIIAAISSPVIKADFGSGLWQGAPIGIPYIVVCGSQQKLAINFTD